ncbi:hypothetical protein SBRCBS47491_003164 [Sporothrix bragantina]|uniref:Uncharacterized protein n=1 Tax=Sporothrix bragantina TaxID=671064 RepID=A0ABP0BCW3_9PEZI
MPEHAPSAADADAAVKNDKSNNIASRPPRTPTTPNSPFSGSFFLRPSPGRPSPGTTSLSRSFNLHALGFSTSPLSPLGRRISFYEGDSGDEDDDVRLVDGSLEHLEEDFSNDGDSSVNDGGHRGGWQTSDDGDGSSNNNGYDGLDDPIQLEDRKDVLIDRLNDMVRHVTSYAPSSPSISNRSASTWNSPGKSASAASGGDSAAGGGGGGAVFTELHAHIDKMEAVLAAEQAAEAAALAASPRCDELAGDLSAVLAQLLKRREESEIIQKTLLNKLAEANRRTAELEAEVNALKDERDARDDSGNNSSGGSSSGTATEAATEKGDVTVADESLIEAGERLADLDDFRSELSFLRLQLRGIEVQCRSYVPADADPQLTESIENWKADWFALRAKVDEERRSATASMTVSMSLLDPNYNNSINDINSTF